MFGGRGSDPDHFHGPLCCAARSVLLPGAGPHRVPSPDAVEQPGRPLDGVDGVEHLGPGRAVAALPLDVGEYVPARVDALAEPALVPLAHPRPPSAGPNGWPSTRGRLASQSWIWASVSTQPASAGSRATTSLAKASRVASSGRRPRWSCKSMAAVYSVPLCGHPQSHDQFSASMPNGPAPRSFTGPR